MLMSYSITNGFEKKVNRKQLQIDDRPYKHFVHGVELADKETTLLRLVLAKYDANIDSPTMDDMSYEIHYYKLWKVKGGKKRLQMEVGNDFFWEPSRKMWPVLLKSHGLDSPDDISIYGCRV